MLNLIKNNQIQYLNVESDIIKLKDIKHKIDVLQAEYDRVKNGLTEGYFKENEEFVGSEGLILATYKSQNRSQFMSAEFKKEYPHLHKEYSKDQILKVFLLKK